jgi:hypothetical protein
MSTQKVSRSKVEVNACRWKKPPVWQNRRRQTKFRGDENLTRKGDALNFQSLLDHAPENALYYPGMYRGQNFK